MSSQEAIITRVFRHPVGRVYQAWTEPEHIARWWSPAAEIVLSILEYDLREGGRYFFRYEWPEGVLPVGGDFLTVKKEDCLIFTWNPREPDPDAGKESMVAVWFRALPEGHTEIELRHTLFPDEPMKQRHEDGWAATLDRLEEYFTQND